MKTLQLHHLAPYLPYELMIQVTNGNEVESLCLTGLTSKDGFDIAEISNTEFYFNEPPDDFYIKPILKPLSSLTKNQLMELIRMKEDYPIINFSPYDIEKSPMILFGVNDGRMKHDVLTYIDLERLSIMQFGKLLEWHFDIFGLIEKGLALDIKTAISDCI